MITETGWRHSESVNPDSSDALADLPNAEQVATYFDLAFYGAPNSSWTAWRDDPLVIAVTPFAFDGSPTEWGHTNWLKLDSRGSIIGTCAVFDYFTLKHQQD